MIEGHLASVDLLVRQGSDVNGRDHGGVNVLMHAVVLGNEPIVRLLLSGGSDPNAPSGPDGLTPLVTPCPLF